MARYECPRCDGGFPETETVTNPDTGRELEACPWCSLPIVGGYDAGLNAVINP